jgi:hypothetical protein
VEKNKALLAIACGIVTSLLILSIGYAYSDINNSQSSLLGNQLRVLLGIVTNGLAFGYWLGLSINNKSSNKVINLFFMSFFGTFSIILSYLLLSQKEIILFLPLFFAISMPPLMIISGLIEDSRLKYFEKAITTFSEKLSFPTLAMYLLSSYYEMDSTTLVEILAVLYVFVYLASKIWSEMSL